MRDFESSLQRISSKLLSAEATSLVKRLSTANRSRTATRENDCRGSELRYMPPYSPDMNPIEKAYSELKALLRHGPSRHLVDVSAGRCLGPIGQHFQEEPARQWTSGSSPI